MLKAFEEAPDGRDGTKDGDPGAERDKLACLWSISSQCVAVTFVRAPESDCLLANLAFVLCQLCDIGQFTQPL